MQTAQQGPANLIVVPPPSTRPGAQNGTPSSVPVAVEQLATPITRADLQAALARKSELSNQLLSAQSRRNSLARQLQSATGVSQTGLEARLVVLDQRLVQLERDIQVNGNLIAQAPRSLLTSTSQPGGLPMNPEVMVPIGVVFTLFVLAPIAFTFARLMWKRGNRLQAPPPSPQSEARLERVEQSVDAIAIEVERITEGQRFITQLLSKSHSAPALGVGQAPAEPIRVGNADAVPLASERLRT